MTAGGAGPGAAPTASVLVLAHDRTNLLEAALQSVIGPSPGVRPLEVLVVARSLDPGTVARFEGRGVRFRSTTAEGLGAKVAEGLPELRGDIVLFLEDDDRFEPGRLEAVVRRFGEEPDLVYYHNAFRLVGPDEAPWTGPFHRRPAARRIERRGRVYRPSGNPPGGWGAFRGMFPGFNNSCIAVRRAAVLPWVDVLARCDLATDEGLFLAGAASGGAILQDSAVLTRIMVHPESISAPSTGDPSMDLARLRSFSDRTVMAMDALAEFGARTGRRDLRRLAEADAALQRIIAGLRGAPCARSTFVASAVAMLARPETLATRNYAAVPGLGFLAGISPGIARSAYRWLRGRLDHA